MVGSETRHRSSNLVEQLRSEQSFTYENNYGKLWDTETAWDKETSLAAFPVHKILYGE